MTPTIRLTATFACLALSLIAPGCARLRHANTAAWIDGRGKNYNQTHPAAFMKNNYYYPIRDAFDLHVLASLFDAAEPKAWNIDEHGNVPDGSFYINRPIADIAPDQAAVGPVHAPPKPPWKVITRRPRHPGKLTSFIAQDATGRTFFVKLGHPDYPQANSAAAVITERILHLLGYYVPPNDVVTITGTGVAEFDGRRAEAGLFLNHDVIGPARFDKFRYRREMRALRIVAAWLDDLDRCSGNTLAVLHNGKTVYYLIDFDSTLGLWQGQPKPPWRSHRYRWDPLWAIVNFVTLGRPEKQHVRHREPVSNAVGIFHTDDFDPLAWKPSHPNSAFRFMTRDDAKWIARKIAQITPQQIRAIVSAAQYTDPSDERHVFETLMARRDKILTHFGAADGDPP